MDFKKVQGNNEFQNNAGTATRAALLNYNITEYIDTYAFVQKMYVFYLPCI